MIMHSHFLIEVNVFFQVYGGEARISTLRELFPLMEDKKSLASSYERSQIKGKASLLAALDYYVSMHSDIFISASPGNMHNALVSSPRCFVDDSNEFFYHMMNDMT